MNFSAEGWAMFLQKMTKRALVALAAGLMMTACGDTAFESAGGGYATAGDRNNAQRVPTEGGEYNETENYDEVVENDFIDTSEEDTSTFSVDVDTASYTVMRRDLNNDVLPQPSSVRPEEYINFFSYDYLEPQDEEPFSINLEMAPSEFGEEGHQLLQIGLQGKEIAREEMKPNNLVFLVDVSGSMGTEDRLPRVKTSLHTLLDHLNPDDTVGIVVYASKEGVELEPTPVAEREKIEEAIDGLTAGGATNAEAGIDLAYEMAEGAKIEGGNNRVIIATDGDFNVGRTGDELVDYVKEYRDKHISLTNVGYGMGNYNDGQLESLARKANGNYFYVDTEEEAERIFGADVTSTLEVIASDVKIQVEFNEETVERYRLIGYENRVMDNEDFDDDEKDAGEIGAGHTVTALYEIEPSSDAEHSNNFLANLRLRYKEQYGDESKLIEKGIKMSQSKEAFSHASDDLRFASAVVEFAEILRESKHSEGDRFNDVQQIAESAAAEDDEQKQEFIELVGKAQTLWE